MALPGGVCMIGLSFARAAAAILFIGLYATGTASAAPFEIGAKESATLRSLAKAARPGVPIDLSIDDNYQAYKALLRAHGLTPDNRPQLFREIEAVRARHIAKHKAAKPGADALEDETLEPNSMFEVIDIGTNDWSKVSSTVLTSVPGGTINSTVTVDLRAADGTYFGNAIGESDYQGIDYAVTAEGTNPYPDHGEVEVLSTFFLTYNDGTPAGPFDADALANYYPEKITNTAPVITTTSPMNTYILICLNRANPEGGAPMPCNYGPYPGQPNPPNLVLPSSGSFKYFGPIDVDGEGKPTNSFVSMTMVGKSTGSACTIVSFNDFWKYATVNNDTLTWAIANPPANFGQVCYQNNELYTYTLTVRVYVNRAPVYATITNSDIPETVSNLVLGKIQVQYGCIAEGTEVLMADGSRKKIENVAVGDTLMAPGNTIAKVRGRTVGWDTDFVSLTDAAGDKVVVTPAHPVILEKGPIKAEKVLVGDRIRRADGSWSEVVKAVRDTKTQRNVYNLVLNPKSDSPPPVEKSEFFAGGILVGDGDLQHSLMTPPEDTRSIAERLPKEWQVDYANYLKEHAAKGTMR
jgi:hypothetical protein